MLMDKLASTIVDHRTSGRYSHSHPNRGEFAKTQPPRKPGWFTSALQGVALGTRQPVKMARMRQKEPVKGRVAQLGLRLDAGQPSYLHALGRRRFGGIVEESGLAHPGLPPQHQRAAQAPLCSPEQGLECSPLG